MGTTETGTTVYPATNLTGLLSDTQLMLTDVHSPSNTKERSSMTVLSPPRNNGAVWQAFITEDGLIATKEPNHQNNLSDTPRNVNRSNRSLIYHYKFKFCIIYYKYIN